MKDIKYPVLYTTSTKGTNYRHCSINETLFFEINVNQEKANTDPIYKEYMEEIKKETYAALIHKFLVSMPLEVTNNHIHFLIFKDNIDMRTVKQFCKAMLDELAFFTKVKHTAKYANMQTMFMEINKEASIFKTNKVGEKLTITTILQDTMEILEGDGKDEDAGILTPFDVYVQNKKSQEQQEENEEIVTW